MAFVFCGGLWLHVSSSVTKPFSLGGFLYVSHNKTLEEESKWQPHASVNGSMSPSKEDVHRCPAMSKVCQWNIRKHGQSLMWSLHWSHTGNANPGKQAATPRVSIRERLPLRGGQSLDNSSSCQSPNTACRWVWPFLSRTMTSGLKFPLFLFWKGIFWQCCIFLTWNEALILQQRGVNDS